MTVKTEVNGDSKRTNDNGPSLDGTLDSRDLVPVQYIDFCPAMAALVSPEQILFSSPYIIFTLLVLIAMQHGQAGVLGRLSLCLCPEKKRDKKGRTLNVSTTD